MDLVWYCTALLLLSPTVSHAMCITNCDGRATDDGMRYPDCVDCDFYIRCETNGMLRRRCPLTLTFNADARNCDYPANAVCGATSATTSSTTTSPTTSQTTISPTTSSTTTTSTATTSSSTTSATTTSTITSPTTSPTVIISPITTSSTTTTTSATTTPAPAPECRNNCRGVVGLGMYPDCGFCRDFRTCFGNHEVFHTCTSGLAYSHVAGNCFPVDQVNCGSSSPILTSSVEEGIDQTTCVDDCSGRSDGNYHSCSTCHGFTTCSNGITYNMTCAVPALWYDSSVGACVAVSSTCFYAA